MANRKQGNDRGFWGRFRRYLGARIGQEGKELKQETHAGTVSIEDAEREIQTKKMMSESKGRHPKPADSNKDHQHQHIEHTSKNEQLQSKQKEPRKYRGTKTSNDSRKTTSGKANKLKELKKPAKPRPAGIDAQITKLVTDSQAAVRNLHTQMSDFAAAAISRSTHAMTHQGLFDHSWITNLCTGSRK
jgi:hypothetical protein